MRVWWFSTSPFVIFKKSWWFFPNSSGLWEQMSFTLSFTPDRPHAPAWSLYWWFTGVKPMVLQLHSTGAVAAPTACRAAKDQLFQVLLPCNTWICKPHISENQDHAAWMSEASPTIGCVSQKQHLAPARHFTSPLSGGSTEKGRVSFGSGTAGLGPNLPSWEALAKVANQESQARRSWLNW